MQVYWGQAMKATVLAIVFFFLHSAAFAADDETIAQRMQDYWGAYTRAEFSEAAGYVLPADLREMKAQLLPVFLSINESTDPNLRSFAGQFFAGMPAAAYADMSPLQVFVALNRFVFNLNPDLMSAIRQSSIEISEVSRSDADNAAVIYRVVILDTPATDFERFRRHRGQWYLRLKEPPRDTAQKFRKLFGL